VLFPKHWFLPTNLHGINIQNNNIVNLVKDENCDLLADSHGIWSMCSNYFCQLLNAHGVNDVRQTDIHTSGPDDGGSKYL
jgi:hypothetical protein